MRWDVIVGQRANVALDDDAAELIATTDGVESGHPILYNTLEVDGEQYEAWGLPPDTEPLPTRHRRRSMVEPADDTASAGVVVLGQAAANTTGADVGDTITVGTAAARRARESSASIVL